MRKILFIIFLGFIFCAFINAQSLDEAIVAAVVRIDRSLPADTKIAIISFSSPTETLNEYIVDELNGNLLRNRRVIPVLPDQNQLNYIQRELRFNTAGEIEIESAQNIGQMLGVEYIITGSLEQYIGNEYRLLLKAYDTEYARLQTQYSASLNSRNDHQLSILLGSAVQNFARNLDDNSWKNKRIYLGGGFGYGNSTFFGDYYGNYIDNLFTAVFTSDIVLTNFLSIGVSLGLGSWWMDYNDEFYFGLSLPLVAKFGGKFSIVELTGNLGYTFGLAGINSTDVVPYASGFTLGGTVGIKAGDGNVFLDLNFILTEHIKYQSNFFVVIGYKIGVGRDR